jgi:hypothetical protein
MRKFSLAIVILGTLVAAPCHAQRQRYEVTPEEQTQTTMDQLFLKVELSDAQKAAAKRIIETWRKDRLALDAKAKNFPARRDSVKAVYQAELRTILTSDASRQQFDANVRREAEQWVPRPKP